MALETLKDVKEIDGFPVSHTYFEPQGPIYVDQDDNLITFRLQKGPVKENGVNGCQVDTMLDACFKIIESLNEKLPCFENADAMKHMALAMAALKRRKADREARGVEGTGNA